MKTTKAYQTLPFEIGLNKNPVKNRIRFFPCYASPLDARLENPSKLILKFQDFALDMPMYVPMSVKQINKCYGLVNSDGDIFSRFVFGSDADRYMKGA